MGWVGWPLFLALILIVDVIDVDGLHRFLGRLHRLVEPLRPFRLRIAYQRVCAHESAPLLWNYFFQLQGTDDEFPDKNKLLENFFIPDAIDPLTFAANYAELLPFPVPFPGRSTPSTATFQHGVNAPLGYPRWFLAAYPDVVLWIVKRFRDNEERTMAQLITAAIGRENFRRLVQTHGAENAAEMTLRELRDNDHIKPAYLRRFVDLYRTQTNRYLECSDIWEHVTARFASLLQAAASGPAASDQLQPPGARPTPPRGKPPPPKSADVPATPLPDGTQCRHEGETSTYCTQCWANLYVLQRRQGKGGNPIKGDDSGAATQVADTVLGKPPEQAGGASATSPGPPRPRLRLFSDLLRHGDTHADCDGAPADSSPAPTASSGVVSCRCGHLKKFHFKTGACFTQRCSCRAFHPVTRI